MTAARRPGYAPTVAVVGTGAQAYAVFERLVAGARSCGPRRLSIVLVDPRPAGADRVWRPGQSRLLRLNARAGEVAVAGPDGSGRPGPSVAEWAWLVRCGAAPTPPDAAVAMEVLALCADSFPSRRLHGAYLEWAYQRLLAALPKSVTVTTVADRVAGLADLTGGRQAVRLANGPALAADAVILAPGPPDPPPRGEHAVLAAFADARGLTYLPPGHAADRDLSGLRPGQRVLVRGFGPAFVDLLALVTEGRGGRFERCDGRLVYRPSGREPVLCVGSRRGVPYRAKPGAGARTALPAPEAGRFFDAAAFARSRGAAGPDGGGARFAEDVWPLMVKEIGWAYYREYFAAHPDRVALRWDEFEAEFAGYGWYDARRARLVARAVPRAADRWEFEAVDRPLDRLVGAAADQVHQAVAEHVRRDLEACERGTATAVHRALIHCCVHLQRLANLGLVHGADGRWQRFLSFAADGPPPFRLRQLLALADAGVVRFAGPGLRLEPDPAGAAFRARSDVTGFSALGAAAVEALLPGPPDDADAAAHPRRFAVGRPDGFMPPGSAPSPQADGVAAAVLSLLRSKVAVVRD